MRKSTISVHSGLSINLMLVQAEEQGLNLINIIEKHGLPNDPTFEVLINLIQSKTASNILKTEALEMAKHMAKNNKDYRDEIANLSPFCLPKQKASSRAFKKESTKQSRTSTYYLGEEVNQQINELTELLAMPSITSKKRKEINLELDQLVISILDQKKGSLLTVSSLYLILPADFRRIPYIIGLIKKLIKDNNKKGDREEIELVTQNKKIRDLLTVGFKKILR